MRLQEDKGEPLDSRAGALESFFGRAIKLVFAHGETFIWGDRFSNERKVM